MKKVTVISLLIFAVLGATCNAILMHYQVNISKNHYTFIAIIAGSIIQSISDEFKKK